MKYIIIVLGMCAHTIYAGETGRILTEMRSNSPRIAAAQYGAEAGRAKASGAGSLPDLQITGGVFIRPVETRVGPQRGRLGAAQRFPLPKTLRAQQHTAFAEAGVMAKEADAVIAEENRDALYWWLKLYESVQVSKKLDELLELKNREYDVAHTAYSVGEKRHRVLLDLNIRIAEIEEEIARQRRILRTSRAELQSRGVSPSRFEYMEDAVPDIPPMDTVADSFFLSENSALAVAQAEITSAKEQIDLADRAGAPDITLSTEYIFTRKGDPDMVSSAESGRDPWMVGVGLSLPLWQRSLRALREEAAVKSRAQQTRYEYRRAELTAQLTSARESEREARRQVRRYDERVIPLAREIAALEQEAYAQDEATYGAVLRADAAIISYETQRIRAAVAELNARNELHYLAGGIFLPADTETGRNKREEQNE
jgi:outer membrane protein TolC